ncbi:MAG: hypothetical protein WDO70_01580 [Alphaproteobacteria bacterium]
MSAAFAVAATLFFNPKGCIEYVQGDYCVPVEGRRIPKIASGYNRFVNWALLRHIHEPLCPVLKDDVTKSIKRSVDEIAGDEKPLPAPLPPANPRQSTKPAAHAP